MRKFTFVLFLLVMAASLTAQISFKTIDTTTLTRGTMRLFHTTDGVSFTEFRTNEFAEHEEGLMRKEMNNMSCSSVSDQVFQILSNDSVRWWDHIGCIVPKKDLIRLAEELLAGTSKYSLAMASDETWWLLNKKTGKPVIQVERGEVRANNPPLHFLAAGLVSSLASETFEVDGCNLGDTDDIYCYLRRVDD